MKQRNKTSNKDFVLRKDLDFCTLLSWVGIQKDWSNDSERTGEEVQHR